MRDIKSRENAKQIIPSKPPRRRNTGTLCCLRAQIPPKGCWHAQLRSLIRFFEKLKNASGALHQKREPTCRILKGICTKQEKQSFGTRSFFRGKAVNRTGLPKFRKKEEGLEWKNKFHRQGLKKRKNTQIYTELGRKEPLNLSCSSRRTKQFF